MYGVADGKMACAALPSPLIRNTVVAKMAFNHSTISVCMASGFVSSSKSTLISASAGSDAGHACCRTNVYSNTAPSWVSLTPLDNVYAIGCCGKAHSTSFVAFMSVGKYPRLVPEITNAAKESSRRTAFIMCPTSFITSFTGTASTSMASVDLSLKYSFGGTRGAPLVSRTINFAFVPSTASSLQEALLERTDLLLADLCAVFDGACDTFDACTSSDALKLDDAGHALQAMMGSVTYATKNVLAQSPSVKYAVMFTRIQTLFARLDVVRSRFGPHAARTVTDFMMPIWSVLRTIDASFASAGTVTVADDDIGGTLLAS